MMGSLLDKALSIAKPQCWALVLGAMWGIRTSPGTGPWPLLQVGSAAGRCPVDCVAAPRLVHAANTSCPHWAVPTVEAAVGTVS